MLAAQHVTVLEALPDPILIVDAYSHGLIWMNIAAENWLRSSFASKQGHALHDIAPGFGMLLPLVTKSFETKSTIRGYDLRIG